MSTSSEFRLGDLVERWEPSRCRAFSGDSVTDVTWGNGLVGRGLWLVMLMLLNVARVGVLPSSDGCAGCSCACGAVLGRGDEFLGDMMSCLEISAACGVLTGRNAAAMMGAARRPNDGDGYHKRRQMCKPVRNVVKLEGGGGCERSRSNADRLRKRQGTDLCGYSQGKGKARLLNGAEIAQKVASTR
jgi:hypothetical protein